LLPANFRLSTRSKPWPLFIFFFPLSCIVKLVFVVIILYYACVGDRLL
jgi:hypothetical protein